jgi:hypothetical protein
MMILFQQPAVFSVTDHNFYSFNYNTFNPPRIGDFNVYALIGLWFAVALCFVLYLTYVRQKPGPVLKRRLLQFCWLVWVAAVLLQCRDQSGLFSFMQKTLADLKVEDRYQYFFRIDQAVSRFTQAVPRPASAKLLTDMPVTDVTVLPYLFFPTLDIVHPAAKPRYLIVIRKKQGEEFPHFHRVSVDQAYNASLWERDRGF